MSLPTPYYQDEQATIYCADCRDVLPHLGRFDLLLTDPPYGIGWKTNYSKSRSMSEQNDKRHHAWRSREHSEYIIGDSKPFDPSHLLGHEVIMLWGAHNYSSKLPDSYSWLVWDKRGDRGAKNKFGDAELCWCFGANFNSVRIFHHLWIGYLRDSEVNERVLHPTQKPVQLMSWCISLSGPVANVLDPYMGSGTTLVAAKLRGIKAVGIELEEKYCAIAVERLRQGVLITA